MTAGLPQSGPVPPPPRLSPAPPPSRDSRGNVTISHPIRAEPAAFSLSTSKGLSDAAALPRGQPPLTLLLSGSGDSKGRKRWSVCVGGEVTPPQPSSERQERSESRFCSTRACVIRDGGISKYSRIFGRRKKKKNTQKKTRSYCFWYACCADTVGDRALKNRPGKK